ncbi:unnamed protein product [Linum tenue]|uniref:Cytochrome P450 n=1 Tax=Linum tenue TaxID=586396 RepID=A0AAV0RY61_9ROSI|nr:unnamed protein product [Linum tenue]
MTKNDELSDDGRLPDSACGKAFEVLEEVALFRHIVPMCVWRLQQRLQIGMEWKFSRAWSTLDQLLYGSIKRKKQELARINNDVTKRDKLDLLTQILVMKDEDDGEERGGFLRNYELNKVVYLHATVCETLRLYAPVPFEHKCAVEADVLPSGHTVRKEERILFSIYTMARMEEIWGEDCMEFKPERWISEKGTMLHVPSSKFMTFLTRRLQH